MKNKFMITISDVHGSKQFTLSQFIKVIARWLLLLILVVLIAGGIFLKILSNKVDTAQTLIQQAHADTSIAKTKTALAQKKIKTLQEKQKELQSKIAEKGDKLSSMNTQLAEMEEILGLDTEIDSSIENRAESVKNSTREVIKKIEKNALTTPLIKVLNQSIPNGYPTEYTHISSTFGYRKHPITKRKSFHAGLDLAAQKGTPIYATANGVVAYAKNKGGYGKYILILHPFGFKTAYAHLSKYNVKTGQYVQKNELIGYVGNTGKSTGPHLHYEILHLHKWLDPETFMTWSDNNYLQIMNAEKKVDWEALMYHINASSL